MNKDNKELYICGDFNFNDLNKAIKFSKTTHFVDDINLTKQNNIVTQMNTDFENISKISSKQILGAIKAVFANLQILTSRKRLLYGWSYLFIYLPKRGC